MFPMDKTEYGLIDNLPTKNQLRYGRIELKSADIKYRSVALKDHLKRINMIGTRQPKVNAKIPKPKQISSVDKTKITTGGLV